MIVYSGTAGEFTEDVFANRIEEKIQRAFVDRLAHRTSKNEIRSWRNSMQYMNNILVSGSTPKDARVAIEYRIPLTSKRVDFILSGRDADQRDTAIIVELKQWETVKETPKDAVVRTYVGGAEREVLHPSYQAWTYASLIQDFNETVQSDVIAIRPCAYLHNCEDGAVINSAFYRDHIDRAPSFLKSDTDKLRAFIEKYVKYGDNSRILYRIEHGRLRPSKNLADHLVDLLKGNKAFEMIDDQKLVYEQALALAETAQKQRKQVLIVEGGPGTGKSVVAINLLVELTSHGRLAHYVTRNAAPRNVYFSKLTGSFKKSHLTNLFKGSGSYTEADPDTMDALIVDEAHRLNEKSGLYQNQGENQIKEIIQAARFSIFFIDEDQRVTLKDIGEKEAIAAWGKQLGADVHQMELQSQFRCNGSEGYLAWVDNALQIRETATQTLEGIDYDFRVLDSPVDLYDLIVEKDKAAGRARLVAGYCWNWKGKKTPTIKDIVIPEYDFAMQWNLDTDGPLWIVTPGSVEQVGCIHTCQGLELDYVGVIIGSDLVVRDGEVVTDASKRSSQDRSVHGYKKMLKEEPVKARALADRIVKNTYRTLMTRGQKGCFVYCTDPETSEYFENLAASEAYARESRTQEFDQAAEESEDY
ncbi:DNA/RNA helicase domain-containing protein [Lentisalinibacter sediminis]|uniref:DNA/RNA helicase domain-containing protein n=1 Tax=Lentisalinibacter sediminis TaxID=2992237 RepID=UPI00386953FF